MPDICKTDIVAILSHMDTLRKLYGDLYRESGSTRIANKVRLLDKLVKKLHNKLPDANLFH